MIIDHQDDIDIYDQKEDEAWHLGQYPEEVKFDDLAGLVMDLLEILEDKLVDLRIEEGELREMIEEMKRKGTG